MNKVEKEAQIKKNSVIGTITGLILGVTVCPLTGLFLGALFPVYTDEEWADIQARERILREESARRQKELEEKRREREKKVKKLEEEKIRIEKELIKLGE